MTLKEKAYKIIFEHDTPKGKQFDVALLWVILISILVVIIESIPKIQNEYFIFFYVIEWIFCILFTIEFAVRVWCSPKPLKYIFSFYGLIDLVSIFPTYLELFLSGSHYFLIIRIFRLLRVFRIFKLVRFNKEAQTLTRALRSSSYKISVFIMTVISIVVILGTIMYVVEGHENGFSSIPLSIYWAIVTVTTVGFGDIVPQTVLGKIISSFAMILGYAIIAVPTGIFTVEMSKSLKEQKKCDACQHKNPDEALFCNQCGAQLLSEKDPNK
jgi:voltage-gated potassium channel